MAGIGNQLYHYLLTQPQNHVQPSSSDGPTNDLKLAYVTIPRQQLNILCTSIAFKNKTMLPILISKIKSYSGSSS